MMETKWYHGVEWVSSDQNGPPGICLQAQVFDHAGQSVACIDPTTDPKTASHYAWLMASAPGIATQRDELLAECERLGRVAQNREDAHVAAAAQVANLLSVQKQLVEALEEIVAYPDKKAKRSTKDGYPSEVVYDEFAYKRMVNSYREGIRAAILAAKASS